MNLHNSKNKRQPDKACRSRADTLIVNRIPATAEKLNRTDRADTQTIFETELEALRKLSHHHTPLRKHTRHPDSRKPKPST
jgi:hypothetical protein